MASSDTDLRPPAAGSHGFSASRRWSASTTKLAFLAIALIYCLSLLPRTFWAENEAYYALGAENVLEGTFLLPVIYDNMLADKPPLMFWWVALISLPFRGVSEFTARFANLIPAFAILLLIYKFGKRIGLKSSLLAAVILATSHEFYEVAFEVNTDILLTALLMGSWIAMFRIFENGFTWKRWHVLWVPMGLAMLTKGPVAPALSCFIALAYAFPHYGWKKGWSRLLSLRPFTGAIVCFLPFVIWCAMVYSRYGREPLDIILLRHNVQRFVEAFDHQKPWFYYLYTLPIVLLPWTLFLPLIAIQWRRMRKSGQPLPAWWTFSITVVLVVFALFSFSSSKRAYYMLPLMPWVSLLLADALSKLGEEEGPGRHLQVQRWVSAGAGAMLGILFLYITVGYHFLESRRSIAALVQEVERTTGTGDFILFAEEDPRVMFYLREHMTYYADKPEANAHMLQAIAENPEMDIISLERPLKRLRELSPVPLYVEGSALYRKNRFYVLTTNPEVGLPELTPQFIKKAKADDKKQKEG